MSAADDLRRVNGRQVVVAGVLRSRWVNAGGHPAPMRAKRPPNARDGARCDGAFQKHDSRNQVSLRVPNSTRRSRVKQWWYFMMFTWYITMFGFGGCAAHRPAEYDSKG
jgi:hypothetical protein